MNYCKNCKFGDFSESRFNELKGKGYGVCNKLVAQTTNGDAEEELVSIELQPLAFELNYIEIGVVSKPIDVHVNFGCILHQRN